MHFLTILVYVIFLLCSLSSYVYADQSNTEIPQVFIHGSTTVNSAVMRHVHDQAEQELGVEIKVYPSSSGRGILTLLEGGTDIAMISSELPELIHKLRSKGYSVKIADLTVHPLRSDKVQFIVPIDSPVESLSKEQIVDLLLGRVTHWRDFGYQSLGRILFITEHPTGGMYSAIEKELLSVGQSINEATSISMQNGSQVGRAVAQLPNTIGFVSSGTPTYLRRGTKVVTIPDVEITQPLQLVTRAGTMTPLYQTVIDKIKELARENGSD